MLPLRTLPRLLPLEDCLLTGPGGAFEEILELIRWGGGGVSANWKDGSRMGLGGADPSSPSDVASTDGEARLELHMPPMFDALCGNTGVRVR
eukprot:5894351-Prymnesium_polylepis.1